MEDPPATPPTDATPPPSTDATPPPTTVEATPVSPVASPTAPGLPADAGPTVDTSPPAAAIDPASTDLSPSLEAAGPSPVALASAAFAAADGFPGETALTAVAYSASTGPGPRPSLAIPALSASDPADSASGVTPVPSAAASFETLAASGFVSPGRPLASAGDETVESVSEPTDSGPVEERMEATGVDERADAAGVEEGTDAAAEPAMAVYWRWMHARLDEHLAHTESEDLGAPSIDPYRLPALGLDDAAEGLAPLRALGVRDRAAFDARPFEGLKDGFARLG
jgi:hypothetical protein